MASPQPNIRDVAVLAGVAPSTVSVVLNEVDGARVSDATRLRVQEAADRLGYTPNANARNLRGKPAAAVAVITDYLASGPYGSALLGGADSAGVRLGAAVMVLSTNGDVDREKAAIRFAVSHQVRAVVLAYTSHIQRAVPRVAVPLVVANSEPADPRSCVAHVVPDERGGGLLAGRELLDLGHRRIGVVTVERSIAADERTRGIRSALRASGVRLDPDLVDVSSPYDSTAQGGYEAANRLLSRAPRPTALFCFSDRMAMGAYRAAAEAGLRVPEDLSIIGYDNLEPVAESLHPGLTTIALPQHEIGELAVELALAQPARGHEASQKHVVPCPLIRRFSASRVPNATPRPTRSATPSATQGDPMPT